MDVKDENHDVDDLKMEPGGWNMGFGLSVYWFDMKQNWFQAVFDRRHRHG